MNKNIWVLLDNRCGSTGQALGIVEAIGDRAHVGLKRLYYNRWGWLPNWIRGRSLLGIDQKESASLDSPYPDIVLSTSRRTVCAARYVRKKSGYKTQIVQLMYPSGGVGIGDMAFFVIPSHDNIKKCQHKKALVIDGAPTRMFANKIEDLRLQWNKQFEHLPKPWVSVLLGGEIKGEPWPEESVEKLATRLREINDKIGGSFLITSSRRTGKKAENIVMDKIKGLPCYTYLWNETKENPIMGFYACADYIVATADSVSMCTEACGTGNPVLLFRDPCWLKGKHQTFAQKLIEKGYAQDVCHSDALDFRPQSILNPATYVADKIMELD